MKKSLILSCLAIASMFASCNKTELTLSGLNPEAFNSVQNGDTTALYVLKNKNGMEVCSTNFGARIVSMMVPDKNGKPVDVVLGYDSINTYATHSSDFGAAIGRYTNRINQGIII